MAAPDTKDTLRARIKNIRYNTKFSGPSSTVPVETGKTWDELKPKQLRNIEEKAGSHFTKDTTVLFIDTTLTNSGKSGFLFTTDGLILLSYKERGVKGTPPIILYSNISSIRQAKAKEQVTTSAEGTRELGPDYMIVEYKDGTVRAFFTSLYTQFVVRTLRTTVKALNLHQTEPVEAKAIPEAQPEVPPEDIPNVLPEGIPEDIPEDIPVAPAAPIESGFAEEDFSNIIELHDENGDPIWFEFLDLIHYEDREYVVLLPVDENEEPTSEEIIILEVVPDPDDPDLEQYLPVENMDVLQSVFEIFRDKFKDLITLEEPEPEARENHEEGSMLPYPYDGGKHYIFISYSHRDTDSVMGIIRQLQADGYRVWYDEGIDPGTEWDDNIASHVEGCACFLAFISREYLMSENCKDELNYARDLNLPRLLIYLEDVALTGGLAMRHNRLQALHYYKYLTMKGMFYKRLYQSSIFTASDLKDSIDCVTGDASL